MVQCGDRRRRDLLRRRRRWRNSAPIPPSHWHVPASWADITVVDVRWLAHIPAGQQRQQRYERQRRRQQRSECPAMSRRCGSRGCRNDGLQCRRPLPQPERPELDQHTAAAAGALQSVQLGAVAAAGGGNQVGTAHLLPGPQSVSCARAERLHLLRTPGEMRRL